MIPVLTAYYPYTGNGLGGLSDALDCIVTHEVNGIYELSMRYPISGLNYGEIQNGYFIMASPDNLTAPQPFRIYRITKPLNGIVTVYAQHISYDMAGTVVEPFTASSLTEAMTVLPNHCTPSTPFTIDTTRTVATAITLSEPRPLWKLLGGQKGSFLDVYGGEWDFNGLTATLKTQIGEDRGVSIRYGKNMTNLEQDASLESTYSAVYPYWYDEESNVLVTLAQKTVPVPGAAVTDRVMLLDCSSDFDDQPTEAQLLARAQSYITNNSVGSVKTSWKVSFVQLSQSPEFADQALLEQVGLGDTVSVHYDTLGVDASARVVKTEYNAIEEHYKSVTIGRVKQNLAAIIVGQNEVMDEKIEDTKSALERAVDAATDSIKNGGGRFRLIYNGDYLQEIVSLDNPDISLAQSVWRWNNGGFGHSSTGYNGSYTLALLPNGSINADMITVGTLTANRVRAGLLTDELNKNSWNLDTGTLTITDGSINIETQSASYDQIVLRYGDTSTWYYESGFSSQGADYKQIANNTEYDSYYGGGGILNYTYDITGGGFTEVSTSYISTIGNSYRVGVKKDGWSETYLDEGGITLRKLSPNLATSDYDAAVFSADGLWFYDENGNVKAAYDPNIMATDANQAYINTTWTLAKELVIGDEGFYVISARLAYSRSAPRGVALVGKVLGNNYDFNLATNESYSSVSGSAVSWLYCGTTLRVTGSNPWTIQLYCKSAAAGNEACYIEAQRIG